MGVCCHCTAVTRGVMCLLTSRLRPCPVPMVPACVRGTTQLTQDGRQVSHSFFPTSGRREVNAGLTQRLGVQAVFPQVSTTAAGWSWPASPRGLASHRARLGPRGAFWKHSGDKLRRPGRHPPYPRQCPRVLLGAECWSWRGGCSASESHWGLSSALMLCRQVTYFFGTLTRAEEEREPQSVGRSEQRATVRAQRAAEPS